MSILGHVLAAVLIAQVVGQSSREVEEKHNTIACGSLREEYVKLCTGVNLKRRSPDDNTFCSAFQNVCFKLPKGEPDMVHEAEPISSANSTEAASSEPKKKNFTKFCKEFKNRYLYVCPDPFRFGQKAIVFCPFYSEKCQVPLPDKPVVPQRKSSKKRGGGAVDQLCRSYRGFAMNYCNNPFLTSQGQYRAACDKYWRYCGKFHQGR